MARDRTGVHRGFSLVELVVVIGVIAVLMGILFPVISKARQSAQRAACASNVRQLITAITLYANANSRHLPAHKTNGYIGQYLWDMPIASRDQLISNGAIRKIFYCPANPGKNFDAFWTFVADPQWSVTGYFFYFPRLTWQPALLNSTYTGTLTNGQPDTHHDKGQRMFPYLDGDDRPGDTELVSDAVMTVNGLFTNDGFMANNGNSTNHIISGKAAQGGNVGFHDGHVVWRPFSEMDKRLGPPLVVPDEYW